MWDKLPFYALVTVIFGSILALIVSAILSR